MATRWYPKTESGAPPTIYALRRRRTAALRLLTQAHLICWPALEESFAHELADINAQLTARGAVRPHGRNR